MIANTFDRMYEGFSDRWWCEDEMPLGFDLGASAQWEIEDWICTLCAGDF